VCNRFAREASPTEAKLFSYGCWLAEIVLADKLKPTWAWMGFLGATAERTSVWEMLGREGVKTTLDRAFVHVAAKTEIRDAERR
jgi:hypothetical protein